MIFKKKFFFCIFSSFLFFVSLSIIISCKRASPSWDVDMVAPLVNSTLTINNIIPDSLVHKNPDNSVDLVYNTSLYALNADSLFKLHDTTLTNFWPYPFSTPTVLNPTDTIIPATPNVINNNLGAVQLSQVFLRSGKMLLSISSGIHGNVDFNYKIPSAKNPLGNIFDTTVTIPAATGTISGTYSGTFDLSGYKMNLTLPTGANVNTLETQYSAIVSPLNHGGKITTISQGDAVNISNTFNKLIVQYAKGYFGSTVTLATDSTPVSLFSHIVSGNLNFEDIAIDFNIENNIGADARVTIENLSSVNQKNGNTVSLTHPIINSPININRAVDNGGTISPSLYKFSINPSNSNILPFIENFPMQLNYKMNLEINPLGNVSGGNDFVYYDKLLKTLMNMTLPLSLIANDFTLADTVNFTMTKETNGVNHGNLYLYAENGFPFTAEAQLYLMDEKFSVIDSLVNIPNVILSPPLDANYICIGAQTTKLTIAIDEKKMSELRTAKKMMVKIKYNTAGNPNYVKIYSNYQINIKIIGDFNFTIGKK